MRITVRGFGIIINVKRVFTCFLQVVLLSIFLFLFPLIHKSQVHAVTIDHVNINLSSITMDVSGKPVGLSALAYDTAGDPIWSGVTYSWGISSSYSIGSVSPTNDNIVQFFPLNVGTGDLFVTATYSSVNVTKSIAVRVTRTALYVRTDGSDSTSTCNGSADAASGASDKSCAFLTIARAIAGIADTGTIYVAAGTYTETVTINKPFTLKGAGYLTTTIKRSATGGPTININYAGTSSNQVYVDGFTISPPTTAGSTDYPVQITDGSNYITVKNSRITTSGDAVTGIKLNGSYSYLTLYNNIFIFDTTSTGDIGVDFTPSTSNSLTKNLGISSNTFTATSSAATHTALNLGAIQDATVSANTFGSKVLLTLTGTINSSKVQFSSNTFRPTDISASYTGGLYVDAKSGSDTTTLSYLTVSNNLFQNNNYGLVFTSGLSSTRVDLATASVASNTFAGNSYGTSPYNKAVVVGFTPASGTLNAERNYWNSATGPNTDGADSVSSYVDYDPYYTGSSKTILSDATYTDMVALSASSGQAQLPVSSYQIFLEKSKVLDLSAGTSASSSGNVSIAGTSYALNSFTHGELSGVNLLSAQSIGSTSVTVNQAVRLDSGISGTPVRVSTINSASEYLVAIPDGTAILAPSSWDGKIIPQTTYTATSSDTLPSGYKMGTHAATIGSTVGLLFDKAVTITIDTATGYIGYKPEGSNNWVRITSTCSGTYDSPTAPTFPGECIIGNSRSTKILTYHFSTFGSLDNIAEANASSSSSSSSDSGACSAAKPESAPNYFEVRMKRNKAILLYTTVKNNVTGYAIVYGHASGSEQYAGSFSAKPGTGEMTAVEVGYLKANTPYYFKMMAVNNCATGEWSGWLGGKTPRTSSGELRYYKYKKK